MLRLFSSDCARLLGVAAVVGGFACTTPNPEYCDSTKPCDPGSATPFCDIAGDFGDANTCIAEPGAPDASVGNADATPLDASTVDAAVADAAAAEYSLVVNVLGDAPGTVSLSSPPGGVCDTTGCLFDVPGGVPVTLTAVDGANASFVGWSDACADSREYGCTRALDSDLVVSATFDPAGQPLRQWSMLGTGFSEIGRARVLDVAIDPDGFVVVLGDFYGSVDFGGLIVGTSDADVTDAFVARYTKLGALDWVRSLPNGDPLFAGAVEVMPTGDVLAVGSTFSGSNPSSEVFVARLERDTGTVSWRFSATGDRLDAISGVTVTESGTIVVAGSVARMYADGINFTSATYKEGMLMWFSPTDGSLLNHITYGGPAMDGFFDVIASGNDVWVTGNKGPAVIVGKYAPTGDALVAPMLFGDGVGRRIVEAPDGRIYVAGEYGGPTDFGGSTTALPSPSGASDGFVVRFSGEVVADWAVAFGSAGADVAHSVALDPFGRVVVAGVVGGDTDFGGGTLTSAGIDGFVASFSASDASYRWARLFGSDVGSERAVAAVDAEGQVVTGLVLTGDHDPGKGVISCPGSTCGAVGVFGP